MQLTIVLFLIASSILAVVHIISLKLSLYWFFLWLDLPVHMLGGAVIALGVFTLYALRVPLPKRWLCMSCVVSFVFIIALLWEVYEIRIGIIVFEEDYIIDTLTDLLMGTIGGFIGYYVGSRMQTI